MDKKLPKTVRRTQSKEKKKIKTIWLESKSEFTDSNIKYKGVQDALNGLIIRIDVQKGEGEKILKDEASKLMNEMPIINELKQKIIDNGKVIDELLKNRPTVKVEEMITLTSLDIATFGLKIQNLNSKVTALITQGLGSIYMDDPSVSAEIKDISSMLQSINALTDADLEQLLEEAKNLAKDTYA